MPRAPGGADARGKESRAGLLSERRTRELSNGFCAKWSRVIGELEGMIEKALEIKQRALFGIGLARQLARG